MEKRKIAPMTVVRKRSKSEELTALTVRNHKDLSSYDISCRATAISVNIREVEAELERLQARQKELRTKLEASRAEAKGLEIVLTSRA